MPSDILGPAMLVSDCVIGEEPLPRARELFTARWAYKVRVWLAIEQRRAESPPGSEQTNRQNRKGCSQLQSYIYMCTLLAQGPGTTYSAARRHAVTL
jgi:hypothetical protein